MEYPYFVVDNLLDGATSVTTNRTAVTGYEVTKLYDNLHHTSYKTTAATSPVTITVTPSAHRKINCVIIETKFSDTSAYYQVSVNGSSVVNTQTTQDVVNGTIILTFTEVVALSSSTVTVSIYSALSTFEVRHMWVGYYRTLPNANYEFDPIQDVQVFRKQDNEDGQIINNSAKYNHKILEATFSNVSPTDFGYLDYLRTNSFYTATPFWFFVRPTTDPTVGFLYHWDTDSYARPFQNGNYRGFQIKAKANYSASRSPDRAPFALTKCLSFASASSQYTSCTDFPCGSVHSIEFWTKTGSATFAATDVIMSSGSGGQSALQLTSTTLAYQATSSTTKTVTHSAVASSLNHWILTRTAGTVTVYLNGTSIGTMTLEAGDVSKAFSIGRLGNLSTSYYNGKLGHVRAYNWVLNSTQIARQYNSGVGNDYLANGLYAVYECDDTGGTSTTEDNAEGTAGRDMAFAAAGAAPARTTW